MTLTSRLGMAALAAVFIHQLSLPAQAEDTTPAALTGLVTSDAEGAMEGVVVTAHKDGSIVSVSVTTDAQGRYAFPENRLEPGHYGIAIRAVGYELSAPAAGDVAAEQTTTVDLKLKTTRKLASQLSNAEWMMSIPGTEAQKSALLDCVGCHTLERIVRSTHDANEWTQVITRMKGYGAVSQPIKPQPMLDRDRAGTPEQYRKMAEYLATINLSAVDKWDYDLKTLPRPTGRSTRAIVTEYDIGRPTSQPHDVVLDSTGDVWYSDFGELYISKYYPKTLKLTSSIKSNSVDTDSLIYDPFTKHVFVNNGDGMDLTVVDAATEKVVGSMKFNANPEAAVSDGKGSIFHVLLPIDEIPDM